MRNKLKKTTSVIVMALLLCTSLPVHSAKAAYAPDFQAGNIMGDSLFFDGGTMNADQIQQYLNNAVPNCDTYGTQTSELGGGTRAQYAAARGYSTPFICLKSYIENPTTHANNLQGAPAPSGGWSAAQIIYNAAVTYSVNPKVLLVTLQKESALVTDTWPLPNQYKTAMGYGCPDTGSCDAQYYGFYNQVTNAARQFRLYANNTSSYRYKAGQVNSILYNPSTSCGSSGVFIQNQATAGLYNYTPYQPNAAAMNNLYGTGDACSAYGNRNFWRNYTDWFGSTFGSDLVRTVSDGTVYLVSGSNKYPIADRNVLNDFSSLGNQVVFVSDAFMSSHTTGPLLGHMVGSPGGTIYFVDAGIKLPFTSCQQVADYGYSCGSVNYLTDGQLGNLASGPSMTSLYKTTSGKQYYITGGSKREVFDQQSLSDAGISDGVNVLLEGGVAYLPYGQPVIRGDVVTNDRDTGQKYLYTNSSYQPIPKDVSGLSYVSSLPTASLDDASIPSAQRGNPLSGFVTDATGTNKYALINSGKAAITNPSAWNVSYNTLSSSLLNALPNSSDPLNNMLIKSPNDATVYYVTGGQKRPIPSWDDLVGLQVSPLTINTLLTPEADSINTGKVVYAPGRLVKSASSSTVYVTGGGTTLFPIGSFTFAQELGVPLSSILVMSDSDLSGYTSVAGLHSQISCSGTKYVGINGKLYTIDSSTMSTYGLQASDFIDASGMCSNLPKSSQTLGSFIRVSNGTIYYVSGGTKQAIVGYNVYLSHGGSSANTLPVSDYFASLIPTGANLTQ